MATIAKAALRNRVLEHLGVVAAGATPATADQTLVEEEIDASWQRLRKFGLVPFATSAVPEWAQQQLCDYVAYYCAPKYGVSGQRLLEMRARAKEAEFDLARQVSADMPPLRVTMEWP